MKPAAGFHSLYPADLEHEIWLAGRLSDCASLWLSMERAQRRLRTNPAELFRRMKYGRLVRIGPGRLGTPDNPEWWATRDEQAVANCRDTAYCCEEIERDLNGGKAGNDSILTPSSEAWPEFLERLESILVEPDYLERYGPGPGDTFRPLAAAELVVRLGFAAAESLALFRLFCGRTDSDIAEKVGRVWRMTRPYPPPPPPASTTATAPAV